jgi:hypothetical protein
MGIRDFSARARSGIARVALVIMAGFVAAMIAAPDARAQVNVLDLSNVDVDGSAPTVRTITLPAGTIVDSIAFDFSVRHFGSSWGSETRIRITAPNGTTVLYRGSSDFGFGSSPGTYSFSGTLPFSVGAPADGTWTISLEDSFNDGANPDHTYLAGSEISFPGVATDTTPPTATTVSLASDNADPTLATDGDTVTLDMEFDEALAGAPTVSILGQAVTATGSGTSWTAALGITGATANGPVGFSVSNFADAAGNTGGPVSATTDGSAVSVDTAAPVATTLSIASDNADPTLATDGDTVTLDMEFDEALAGAPTVSILGQAVTATGGGTSWTASLGITGATAEGSLTFSVSNFEDAAGNTGGPVSTTTDGSAVSVDTTPPGLAITGVPATYLPGDTFVATFTFAEVVTGFDVGDIAIAGGTLSGFSGSGTVYTVTVTPDGQGDVTLTVAEGAAQDAAGNPSAAASATSRIDSATVASEMIADFMHNRARNLVQNQPGLIGLVRGTRNGHADVAVTRNKADFDIASGGDQPLWFTLSGSLTDQKNGIDSAYALASMGGHVELSTGVVVGAMIQVDHAEDDHGGGIETSGNGWLVGPYVVAQLGEQPIYFEGRLLYGESSNKVSPLGTFTDDFDSDRYLALIALEGSYQAEAVRYFPRLQFSHVRDRQGAYVDGLSNPVPAQKIRLSELSAGVDFETPLFGDSRDHLVTWGVSGIWSRVDGSGAASAFIDNEEGGRARLDLGYLFDGGDGLTASAGLFLDGIGAPEFDSYGLEVGVNLRF